nr:ran GTPase activating protein 1 [Hymenolepis microstoma]
MASNDNREVLVDFDGRSLKVDSEKDANEIVEEVKKNYMMTALCLSANTIGVNGAKAIGDELAFHKNLERCLFSDMFTGRLVDEIAPSLKHFSKGIMTSGARLTELDLSDNAFGPRGVVGVTELISSPTCYTLKILRMNNQGLGHQGAKHLAEALSKGIEESGGKGLKLTHFSAGRNRLENYGACLLADVFARMGSLEELALYQNGIGIHGPEGIKALASAISKNANMRILNLSDNSLTEEGGSEVAKILNSIPSLEELILDDCLIRSKGCRALAHYIEREDIVPNLTRLSLYGNEIRRDSAISLAFALVSKSHLNHLCLNANEFGPSGVQSILQVLESLNLLPALRAGINIPGEDEEDEGDDDLLRAFDEDIGEDQEESEVEKEDEEQSYDEEYYDDEGTASEDEGDDERDTSFNTVKNMSTKLSDESVAAQAGQGAGTGGFSFLSCLSSLKENQQPTKSGLFADINMIGSGTSSPSGGLFGGLRTTNFSGGLFAPPKLGSLSTGLFSTASANFNESALLDSLRGAFIDTEDENMITSLVDQVSKQTPPPSWKLQGERIIGWTSPESLVRLAFRITQKVSSPVCQNFASDLIFTALSQRSNNVDTSFVEPTSRAVNFILLHLGAIKADKSDSLERKIHEEIEDQKTMKANVNLVSSLLNRYGDNLSTDVKKPLKCIISLRRNQSAALETLLTNLESKMSFLTL